MGNFQRIWDQYPEAMAYWEERRRARANAGEASHDTKEAAGDRVPDDLIHSGTKYQQELPMKFRKLEGGTSNSEKAGDRVKMRSGPELISNFSDAGEEDLEKGLRRETEPEEIHCGSGFKTKFKPHQPRPWGAGSIRLILSGMNYLLLKPRKLEQGTSSSEKAGDHVPEITSNSSDAIEDLEKGLRRETEPEENHCGSGFKTKFKPHQPRPGGAEEVSTKADPRQGGDVKVKEVSSRVKRGTQMLLPASVGCGVYIVVGQGAFYNPAFAFSVFVVYVIGVLSMFLGWYMESNHLRVSELMQILGQVICVLYLLLNQTPVSNMLKH